MLFGYLVKNARARRRRGDAIDAYVAIGVLFAKRLGKGDGAGLAIAKQLDMARYFSSVIGGDATPSHKPDPAHLMHVLDELGLRPDQVVYVGDTKVDLATAKSASVRFFAVAWADPEAHEKGFSEILNNISDLPKILQDVA